LRIANCPSHNEVGVHGLNDRPQTSRACSFYFTRYAETIPNLTKQSRVHGVKLRFGQRVAGQRHTAPRFDRWAIKSSRHQSSSREISHAKLYLSSTPGFSRCRSKSGHKNRFNGLSIQAGKTAETA
jgi:hypothetical protein